MASMQFIEKDSLLKGIKYFCALLVDTLECLSTQSNDTDESCKFIKCF
jgi:hypothetical protein